METLCVKKKQFGLVYLRINIKTVKMQLEVDLNSIHFFLWSVVLLACLFVVGHRLELIHDSIRSDSNRIIEAIRSIKLDTKKNAESLV